MELNLRSFVYLHCLQKFHIEQKSCIKMQTFVRFSRFFHGQEWEKIKAERLKCTSPAAWRTGEAGREAVS